VLLTVLIFAVLAFGNDALMVWILLITLATMLIIGFLTATFRPETDTVMVISFISAYLIMAVTVAVAGGMAYSQNEKPDAVYPPLTFADLGMESGSTQVSSHNEQQNFLGSSVQFTLRFEDQCLEYKVLTTKHDWILDKIWNKWLEKSDNEQRTECSAAWSAEHAFRNHAGDYYIRYDDTLLTIRLDEDIVLSQEQIDTVRDKLELE